MNLGAQYVSSSDSHQYTPSFLLTLLKHFDETQDSTYTFSTECSRHVSLKRFEKTFNKEFMKKWDISAENIATMEGKDHTHYDEEEAETYDDEVLNSAYFFSTSHKLAIVIVFDPSMEASVRGIICSTRGRLSDAKLKELKKEVKTKIKKLSKSEKKESKVNFICQSHGLYLKPMPIKEQKEAFPFEDNYNDDFKDFSDRVVKALNQENKQGLFLLHGIPGSGKTSYIRYLITKLNKKVIYISPNMTSALSAPSFTNFIMDNSNSILLIEDGEGVLQQREGGVNDAVSNLLNVTDGILGDALNVQVVCTFNTDMKFIDKALLRPGRLIDSYKFGKLSVEKTNKLYAKLNGDDSDLPNKELVLAEIYNKASEGSLCNDDDDCEEKRKIGFY